MNKKVCETIMKMPPLKAEILPKRRVYADDGCKINLPPELAKYDFHNMTAKGANPQALVSCIYSLDYLVPVHFIVDKYGNERASIQSHLENISPNDVVMYDRGYFSFILAKMHQKMKIDFIFRLARNGFKEIMIFLFYQAVSEIFSKTTDQSIISKRLLTNK